MTLDFDSARLPNEFETIEDQEWRTQLRKFFDKEIIPFAAEWDEQGEIPKKLWSKGAAMGVSALLIAVDAEGVSRTQPDKKQGWWCSDTATIYFDDIRVPVENLLGEKIRALKLSCLNMLESCINETINYTRERKAFDKSILDNQAVHFSLAEMQSEIDALRALAYNATEEHINGSDVTAKASMAKLKAGRLSRKPHDACLQYFGGMGYMWDNPIARVYRDSRLTSIGGADEVMFEIVCKNNAYFTSSLKPAKYYSDTA